MDISNEELSQALSVVLESMSAAGDSQIDYEYEKYTILVQKDKLIIADHSEDTNILLVMTVDRNSKWLLLKSHIIY